MPRATASPRRGHGPHLYSWPQPKPRRSDPVDPRMIRVIRRALLASDQADVEATAEQVAARVWDWLAEGDS